MSEFHMTAVVLRVSLSMGVAIMALGLLLSDNDVLLAGTVVLVCAPVAGFVVATAKLVSEKDWRWVKTAAVLAFVLVAGILISLFRASA